MNNQKFVKTAQIKQGKCFSPMWQIALGVKNV